jgi:hypothetical protein
MTSESWGARHRRGNTWYSNVAPLSKYRVRREPLSAHGRRINRGPAFDPGADHAGRGSPPPTELNKAPVPTRNGRLVIGSLAVPLSGTAKSHKREHPCAHPSEYSPSQQSSRARAGLTTPPIFKSPSSPAPGAAWTTIASMAKFATPAPADATVLAKHSQATIAGAESASTGGSSTVVMVTRIRTIPLADAQMGFTIGTTTANQRGTAGSPATTERSASPACATTPTDATPSPVANAPTTVNFALSERAARSTAAASPRSAATISRA